MLQSKIFGKTNKDSKQYDSVNATLLQKAGFIDKTMAGVYTFLPLGARVLQKIEDIIREEMDKLGPEVLMPAIVPKELWEKTDRFDNVNILFKAVGANKASLESNDAEYVLNSTHEEVITPIAKKFNFSYKDLPFAVYQIQTKFRNETRPKSGLLRCREFRMKDLYSFHKDEKDLLGFYDEVKKSYTTIFDRLGLGQDTVVALASGGDFTDGFSHEFQTKCETGEDLIFHSKKLNIAYNKEVAPATAAPFENIKEKELPLEEVEGKGIIGVEELSKYLKIPVEKTTKTILFETDKGKVIAAAVRGGYDINEAKLKKIVGCKILALASEQVVKKVTGAQIGYAGFINLPKSVDIYLDDSVAGRKNFECGANRTDYHSINVNFGRDVKEPKKFYDFKIPKAGDFNPETGEKYEVFQACEVGNIFPLNTKFTKAFDYYYSDKNGKKQIVYMGSYGIGSSRVMGVLVEKFHDEKGMNWPENVAPFKVHLLQIGKDDEVAKKAKMVYDKLLSQNIEVLFDDRIGINAGEKFAEADLIGIPYRFVVSAKTKDKIEIKKRTEDKVELLDLKELLVRVK